MGVKYLLLIVLINIYLTNGAIFMWSNNKLDVTPLTPFDDEDLENIIRRYNNPKVYRFKVTFKTRSAVLPSNLEKLTHGYYSAYNPNGNIATLNAIDLPISEECDAVDILKLQEVMHDVDNGTNFLSIVDVGYARYKREMVDEPLTPSPQTSVVYMGQNKSNLYTILYSSRPLLLKVNTTEISLPSTSEHMIIVDGRLNVNIIPQGSDKKITLRFSFTWKNGYWYLPSVKITDYENYNYTLSTNADIMAPAHFSYHCNGETVFSNGMSDVELYIYDLQVQPDSKNKKFGDANDCVSFTTAPIWSGLFVTTILGLGLIIAVSAIMDIKTMDKFDNHKTKNLGITVSE